MSLNKLCFDLKVIFCWAGRQKAISTRFLFSRGHNTFVQSLLLSPKQDVNSVSRHRVVCHHELCSTKTNKAQLTSCIQPLSYNDLGEFEEAGTDDLHVTVA